MSQPNKVLVRDCDGKIFEMQAVSAKSGLVYVVPCGDDDGLGAIGFPEEDVFEFTTRRTSELEKWKGFPKI